VKLFSKKWEIFKGNGELQRFLARELGISPLLSQLLINRDITDIQQAKMFLSASLNDLHSPFLMKDMERAVTRIAQALKNSEKIVIYGDYDVDGITGTAILCNFLEELGGDCSYFIPEREREGYGLNLEAIRLLKEKGTGLLITVDCGIGNFEEVSFARDQGMDVIITDHHEIPDRLPPAYAILNPRQKDCSFPFKALAGVGIAFNLIIALRSYLRDSGHFANDPPPNLKEYLDLVSLGTVADMVPLVDENRIFVKYGLKLLTEGSRVGIRALKETSGLKDIPITTVHIGFRLGPRINAPGRIDRADEGLRLLITKDPQEADSLAKSIDIKNSRRQQMENEIVREIKERIERDERFLEKRSLVLSSSNWHPGVIGICASRIVEEYYRPTVLIALDGEKGKGSARSIEAFHLYNGLKGCECLLEGFGGHKHAAGLTILPEKIEEFEKAFEEIAYQSLKEEDLIPRINIDAEINLKEVTENLIDDLERLAPFGYSNPEPTFSSFELKLYSSMVVGNGHLKMKIREDGIFYDAIGFNMGNHFPLSDQKIRLAFVPQFNVWQGVKSIQLRIKDIKIGEEQ
jgi:single-stranded-DNA-specific exonuclease